MYMFHLQSCMRVQKTVDISKNISEMKNLFSFVVMCVMWAINILIYAYCFLWPTC